MATCFLIGFCQSAHNTTVIVVHKNAHMIIAIPHGRVINPLCAAANVIAIVAPLDCMSKVIINQITKNIE